MRGYRFFFGQGLQRLQVDRRQILLGFDIDRRVVADDEIDLEPRGGSLAGERLLGHVVLVADEFVHQVGLECFPELGCARSELSTLQCGQNADVEKIVFG
jgi:hypothetical protein